jgi:hypothetical protein
MNCPACKRRVTLNDLHDVTDKPQELKMAEEKPITPHNQDRALVSPKQSGIYSQISRNTLAQIKNIDLAVSSFTTKVDTLCRYLLWLREADPCAKSIIFSQFSDFPVIRGRAFTCHSIGYSTIDKPGGIEKFKSYWRIIYPKILFPPQVAQGKVYAEFVCRLRADLCWLVPTTGIGGSGCASPLPCSSDVPRSRN